MSAARYPTPGEKTDIVKALSPSELTRAIAHQLVLIDKHKAIRPANTDIPALTTWAQVCRGHVVPDSGLGLDHGHAGCSGTGPAARPAVCGGDAVAHSRLGTDH
jgi:hypothetical protein